ncbi:hypothetical protein BZG36_01264 [Bifiguratus adelaidae]|uniref:Beta-hexosaminidase n=1 Tax=Bifiguratus adelaidae TaxID=1938954 RepID=A0A261Y562_9FUNG|nr:hypothetical protein BZG36_01264 [Bifiguratus adelaidae]
MKVWLSIAAAIAALSTAQAVLVNPLPKPVNMTWSNDGPITLTSGFKIKTPNNAILSEAASRNVQLISKERYVPKAPEGLMPNWPPYPGADGPFTTKRSARSINSLDVKVANLTADLQHGVDESYTLSIAPGAASISAQTVWGALRGMETFNQIVIQNPSGGQDLIVENSVHISDAPIYPHRGLLLDTARNFCPVESILKQIDALAWSKMNVLHWHMSDTQSWPMQIKAYPQMTKDAYSASQIYTTNDVKTVINYARQRGVRVLPELDMPAHANSGWKQIDPKIVSCGDSWWDNDGWTQHTAVEPPPGQLDIAYNGTYTAITNVYNELAAAFPEQFWHGGWDEPVPYCYNYSSSVHEWFAANSSRTFTDLYNYFVENVHPILTSKKSRAIYWEDVILGTPSVDPSLLPSKTTIMQTWNNGPVNTKKLTSMGYDVIVSSADFYYLDCGFGGWVTNDNRYDQDANNGAIIGGLEVMSWGAPAGGFNYLGTGGSWCAPYKSWQRIYDYDVTYNLTSAEAAHVLGGEVAMWSEQADATVVDGKVWPRTAAFAESMWSGNLDSAGNKRYRDMTQRILEFRERLVGRGVSAAPLVPQYCLSRPHQCDLNRAEFVAGFD